MPNQANRSNGSRNSGKGHAEDPMKKASAPKANPERSDKKQGSRKEEQGSTGRTSNEGRKRASGGSEK